MKKYINELFSALNFVWDEVFDLPSQMIFKNSPRLGKNNVFILSAFPLLGFLAGMLIALPGVILAAIFNTHAAGVLFAVAAWVFLCFKDSGRGDGWMGNYFFERLRNHENGEFIRNVLTIFPVLLKFAILLFIGLTGKYFFFAAIICGAFTLQAALISSEDCPVKFVSADERAVKVFRWTLVILAIIMFLLCRAAAVGAVAAVCLLYIIFNRIMRQNGFTVAAVSHAGYIAEWVLLVTGLLLL